MLLLWDVHYLNFNFLDAGLGYEVDSSKCNNRGDDACGICVCQVFIRIYLLLPFWFCLKSCVCQVLLGFTCFFMWIPLIRRHLFDHLLCYGLYFSHISVSQFIFTNLHYIDRPLCGWLPCTALFTPVCLTYGLWALILQYGMNLIQTCLVGHQWSSHCPKLPKSLWKDLLVNSLLILFVIISLYNLNWD